MSALAALIIGWIIFIKRNGLLSIEKLYTTTCIFNNSSDVESFLWVIIIIFFTSNPLCNHSHRNCAFIKLINPQHEKVLWKKKNKKQIVTVGLLKNNMYSNNLLKKTKLILNVIEKKNNEWFTAGHFNIKKINL